MAPDTLNRVAEALVVLALCGYAVRVGITATINTYYDWLALVRTRESALPPAPVEDEGGLHVR